MVNTKKWRHLSHGEIVRQSKQPIIHLKCRLSNHPGRLRPQPLHHAFSSSLSETPCRHHSTSTLPPMWYSSNQQHESWQKRERIQHFMAYGLLISSDVYTKVVEFQEIDWIWENPHLFMMGDVNMLVYQHIRIDIGSDKTTYSLNISFPTRKNKHQTLAHNKLLFINSSKHTSLWLGSS